MTRLTIQDFDPSAPNNTDIGGINTGVGWPPTNVGSAFRALMAMLVQCLKPVVIPLSGSTLTLSAVQRTAIVKFFTGSLTGNVTVTLPPGLFVGSATNNTVGSRSVILTTGSGTTVTIPPDSTSYMFEVDGSGNVVFVNQAVGALTSTGVALFKGKLFVNPSAPAPGVLLNQNGVVQIGAVAAATGFNLIQFLNNGVALGNIAVNGSGVGYNTTSDVKLKLDDGAVDGCEAISLIRKMKAHWFRWKSNPDDRNVPGFFAQQLYRVMPWAVTKGKGRLGSKTYEPWTIDVAALVPIIVASLQNIDQRLTDLERRP